MNARMDKGPVMGNFELSPYFSFRFHMSFQIKTKTTVYIPDNLCHTGATCCRFWKIHCRITYCIFLCGKRNNNN